MDAATERELEEGLRIRVATPPYFIATKLEAFHGRGKGDYANSHDLEDLLTVIDGRDVVVGEIAEAVAVRGYIAREFRALLETLALLDALPGYLLPDPGSQERLPILKGPNRANLLVVRSGIAQSSSFLRGLCRPSLATCTIREPFSPETLNSLLSATERAPSMNPLSLLKD
jgi:hypothetical protein